MKRNIKAVLVTVFMVSLVGGASQGEARVTGPCDNCHTMHNSQDGSALTLEPEMPLLKGNDLSDACVACHSGEGNITIAQLSGETRVPIVNTVTEPTYPPNGNQTSTLAAGNFFWVRTLGDGYGHNCLSIPDVKEDADLSKAPGIPAIAEGPTSCQGCHSRIDGCTSCHKPAHHADDDSPLVAAEGGWYRFLKSTQHSGPSRGVIGIEDSDWEQNVTESKHNEYRGSSVVATNDNSMSDYCAGCHDGFHDQSNTAFSEEAGSGGSVWFRHPTHIALPESEGKDYRLYNTQDGVTKGNYSPEAPIARNPSRLDTMVTSEAVVTPGSDQVFCLSCHRVHGSPYLDILRWDYAKMIADKALPEDEGHGCFVCHVTKD